MCSEAAPLVRRRLHGATMGTRYRAVFYAPAAMDVAALNTDLLCAVEQVDRQMSRWDRASDLSRVNDAPLHAWIAIPAQLAAVLAAALQVGVQSAGAFDIGVGAQVDACGFGAGARNLRSVPAPFDAPYLPAAERLDFDQAGARLRKRAPIAIDLSGIAKGYGVDQLATCLERPGLHNYLVGIDGEMRGGGGKPDGAAWVMALERARAGVRSVAGVMALRDVAIATSGDYRHTVTIGGRQYAHTIAPALQQPLANTLAAVSVLASACMLADAWATALLVAGEENGLALARRYAIDALFVVREGAALREVLLLDGCIS
ncbi:FAD:protein FMN transferase [Massilia sp. PWRC2]|uniref:FAD:protein FMN transferase n=1 Tax=Massilia sp. PWRC2 TaxID=2804626 RepID=UPI003CFB90FC